MTGNSPWQPAWVRDLLRARGFDVDPPDPRSGGNSVRGRRERGDAAQLVAIDSGGRFQAELTVTLSETRRTGELGSVPVVIVSQDQRTMTVTGTLPTWSHLPGLLEQLDALH